MVIYGCRRSRSLGLTNLLDIIKGPSGNLCAYIPSSATWGISSFPLSTSSASQASASVFVTSLAALVLVPSSFQSQEGLLHAQTTPPRGYLECLLLSSSLMTFVKTQGPLLSQGWTPPWAWEEEGQIILSVAKVSLAYSSAKDKNQASYARGIIKIF